MVFSSYAFILVFLPIALLLTALARRAAGPRGAVSMLLVLSWAFYAYWDWRFLPLLLLSTLGNFLLARQMDGRPGKTLLIGGVIANLALLGYFKYANFFLDNLEQLLGTDYHVATIILPIGISFFTFQQIAYLVDTWRSGVRDYSLRDYALFVSFFPQLIAGPIVHHRDLVPQLRSPAIGRLRIDALAPGLAVFTVGLAKKVLIADTLGGYADPLYAAAAAGAALSMLEAWSAALLYGLQLYFDFSGYADMAIGLGLMLGIRLPANFDRPYRATSVRDFWRRWHITLSSFLRDYVYIPLGGSRHGAGRQTVNLMTTMVLGGLWHGAGWVFLVWGALHGAYLVLERLLAGLGRGLGDSPAARRATSLIGWGFMLLAVFIAWVPFRAPDLDTTLRIWTGMFSAPLLPQPFEAFLPGSVTRLLESTGLAPAGPSFLGLKQWAVCLPLAAAALLLSLWLPNGRGLLAVTLPESVKSGAAGTLRLAAAGAAMGLLFVGSLVYLSHNTVFLYFQF